MHRRDLEKKAWYRLVRALYVIAYVIVLLIVGLFDYWPWFAAAIVIVTFAIAWKMSNGEVK